MPQKKNSTRTTARAKTATVRSPEIEFKKLLRDLSVKTAEQEKARNNDVIADIFMAQATRLDVEVGVEEAHLEAQKIGKNTVTIGTDTKGKMVFAKRKLPFKHRQKDRQKRSRK